MVKKEDHDKLSSWIICLQNRNVVRRPFLIRHADDLVSCRWSCALLVPQLTNDPFGEAACDHHSRRIAKAFRVRRYPRCS